MKKEEDMADITRFKEIFSGLDIAYGTYRIEGSRQDGKQAGKAVVVRKPPTDDLWTKHLEGVEPSLGIIPIRADNTCIWGCIDIDQYPLDHARLVQKIADLGLPLVVCRSKSGGAHVFLFTTEPIPAAESQEYLRAAASLLGEAGREIFPKQAEILVERGDTGNFLNLPYFAGDQSLRYAIKPDGTAASLEEFYELWEANAQTPPLAIPRPKEPEEGPIKDGPPCLQTLCANGFPEGTRNNGMFNIGVYLKKAHPASWEDKMMEYNFKYMSPPLSNGEMQTLLKQTGRKDYKYKCKDAPLNSYCNSGLCRGRKHGIGGDGPDSPTLTSLSKYNSEPPLWFLDINGKRIELDTDSLFNQAAFQKSCIEKLNVFPPSLKRNDWETVIQALLVEMVETEQITEASEDTSINGRFYDLLEEFTTHMQQGMVRDEIIMGKPWTDEEEGLTYFRIKDLEAHLRRSNFMSLTSPKVAQRLREIGGEPISLNIKGRTSRCWRIPRHTKQDAPFDVPKSEKQGSPF
jgi:hypothetical protein